MAMVEARADYADAAEAAIAAPAIREEPPPQAPRQPAARPSRKVAARKARGEDKQISDRSA